MDGRNKLRDRNQNLHAIPLHKGPLDHADESESSNKTRNSQSSDLHVVSGNKHLVVLREGPGTDKSDQHTQSQPSIE
jgi:hypothetical protein